MPKYDWQAIKAAYVEGVVDDEGNRDYPSIHDLSAQYGPHVNSVKRRCANDNWVQERDLFCAKVDQARQERKTEILAGKGAEFDAKTLRISERGLDLVSHALKNLGQTKENEAESVQVDIVALKDIAMSLEKYQKVGRLSLGDSTDHQKVNGGPILNLSITKSDDGS